MTQPRIAAICANNNNHNAGMITVDLALRAFVAHNFPSAKLDLFTTECDHVMPAVEPSGALEYKQYTSWEQLLGYDCVLFWGDFLHARSYIKDVKGRIARGSPNLTVKQVEEQAKEISSLLFLDGAPNELLRRVVCFGNSVYLNNYSDEADVAYLDRVSRLYNSAAAVMLRDPLSAEFARRYGDRDDSTQGVDCAFLLRPTAQFKWGQSIARPNPRIGFSFGRGPSRVAHVKEQMLRLVEATSARLGPRDVVDLRWIRANAGEPIAHVARKLEAINQCDLIITDTYHCAVNAWREAVPTVCIGFGTEAPSTTISDKKKELLYAMIQGREFYFYSEGEGASEKQSELIAQLCTDRRRTSAVSGTLHKLAAQAERRLVKAITGLIA